MENNLRTPNELLSEISSLKKQLAVVKSDFAREINELKKRNKYQVHAEKEIFRKISNHTQDIYFELDLSWKILYISPSFERVFGFKQKDFINQELSSLFSFNKSQELKDFQKEMKSVGEKEAESKVVTKSGKEIWVYYYVRYIEHEGHNPSIVGIMYDITEKKKTEKDLAKREAVFESVMEASPDMITITDIDGKVLYTSDITWKLFGYKSLSEFIGRPLFDFIIPSEHERVRSSIQGMFEGRFTSGIFTAVRADGSTFPMEVN
ncbi:MAG: PAS domain-containing protein, partial [Bacteroidales bacterium]|nr:PAS domain-containing protein [Bacteroidales bacterium]